MTTQQCKFKVGDAVVFERFGDSLKGKVVKVDDINKIPFPVVVFLDDLGEIMTFTLDGRCHTSDTNASLRLASEKPTWTVILLYPDYMTGDFGADIYVDSAEADDPYEAVKIVQEIAAAANSKEFPEKPNDFRCTGVIKGEHDLVLDAMSF